jgi:L,D-transpeptidase ErfK/SrfK
LKPLWLLPCLLTLLSACDGDSSRGGRELPGVVGEVRKVRVERAAAVLELAQRHAISVGELARANPDVASLGKGQVEAGTELVLPTRFVLPDAPHEGIVVNIAEMRLYYFEGGLRSKVLTFPAAVGREGWETPTGATEIAEKIVDPKWYPPDSIRRDATGEGKNLPEVVPPGPDNPLGKYALRLGWNKHMIHGTNSPRSIGRPVTHGCIRLYAEDMKELFERVKVGTPVRLIDQPYKLGVDEGALYLETHPAASGAGDPGALRKRIEQWLAADDDRRVDEERIERALRMPTQGPVKVSL